MRTETWACCGESSSPPESPSLDPSHPVFFPFLHCAPRSPRPLVPPQLIALVHEGQQHSLCPGTELDVQAAEPTSACSSHCGGAAGARCPPCARDLGDLELGTRWDPATLDSEDWHLTQACWPHTVSGIGVYLAHQCPAAQCVGSPTIRFKRHVRWKWYF